MAVLTVEVPDELITKIEGTGRPVAEVVTQALERELDNVFLSAKAVAAEPSREEILRRLKAANLIESASVWERPGKERWEDLTEEEKQQHLDERNSFYFPDSEVSRLISENRR